MVSSIRRMLLSIGLLLIKVHFEGVGVKTQIIKKNAPSFYSRQKMVYLFLSSKSETSNQ